MRRRRDARRGSRLQRGRWTWWLAPAALVLVWTWRHLDASVEAAPAETRATPPATTAPDPRPPPALQPPYSTQGVQARRAQREMWQRRLERAQDALAAYRQSTRYPHESQPLEARSDQAYPNEPIAEEHALDRDAGKAGEGATLRTTQERVYVQGAESVRFTLSVRDSAGRALPLRILRSSAREISPPHTGSLYPMVPLAFNDDGTSGDATPSDGVHTAQLQPETQGFAGLFGQIRVEAALRYQDKEGVTYFDIHYTPRAPATWQASVRESIEDGSLVFHLGADVSEAGRYVVSARVDDASGKPFALLTFNEEVAQGRQEFRLTLFGKLVRDVKPQFPLTLRDVIAFRLLADTFPDRSLMPRLPGQVHVSRDHPLDAFADAEWASEERTRYLDEFSRDVADAQSQVDRLSGDR